MSFIYDNTNVDFETPGYPVISILATRARNIISIINRRLAEVDAIVAQYNAAYDPIVAALTYGGTLDLHSKNPNVIDARIANDAQISELYPALTLAIEIVKANGGTFAYGSYTHATVANNGSLQLPGKVDFSAKVKKLKADLNKYIQVLTDATPEVRAALPSDNAIYAAMVNQAKADQAATAAPLIAQALAQDAYQQGLVSLNNPNQSSLDPGYAARNSVEGVSTLLNQGVSSGALVWDVATLKVAARTTANGGSLSDTELSVVASGLPKGATLQQAQTALNNAGRTSNSRAVVAKSAPAKGAPAAKPAAKAAPVRATPPKPAPKPAAVKTPPAKPAPKPAAPRAQLPKPKGK